MGAVCRFENRLLAAWFRALRVLVVLVVGTGGLAARAAPVTLWNEVTGDGSLTITTDDFGSLSGSGGGGPKLGDLFDPSPDPFKGDLPAESPTFSTLLYLFVDPSAGLGNGTHRGAATSGNQAGNLECTVISPNTTDQLPLQTHSVFDCTGNAVDLRFELTQRVSRVLDGPNGEAVAMWSQTYAITSQGPHLLQLIVTKHIDQDMPWGPGSPFHMDDRVGMDLSELSRPQVFSRDSELATAVMLLRTREDMTEHPMTTTHPKTGASNSVYYAGKQNLPAPPGNPDFPGGQCPAHDYGTDFQIWNNYGLPNCWKNYVPAVGYDVPGIAPPVPGDAFMGLQTEALMPSGSTYEITYVTVYGRMPGMVFGDGDLDGDIDLDDFDLFLSCFSGAGTPHSPEEACARFDSDADGDVDFQDFYRFQRAFVSGQ